MGSALDDTYDQYMSDNQMSRDQIPSDFPPASQAEEIFGGESVVTPANIHAIESSVSSFGDSVLDYGDSGVSAVSYTINDENKWGWITLYVVTIVVAVLGNLLFIIGSLCTRRSRNTGHYLLINLSIRDILLAGLCIPFTLDSEIIHLTWNLGLEYCISYRYFYYCLLFFLPLTILFLAWHLFVENAKWAQSEDVPRPWPHTIYIPLIWFFSALFAAPTAFFTAVRPWEDDPYKNIIAGRPENATVCMHKPVTWGEMPAGETPNIYFYLASFLFTFVLPVVLLIIPWFALFIQSAGCCTRRLRSSDFWLSLITLFLILIFEASRAPFELFNVHYVLTTWSLEPWLPLDSFIPMGESYIAVMKWAVYAPAMVHPLLYFTFCADARHGVRILFGRLCACCYSKSGDDCEAASDDEKNKMLPEAESINKDGSQDGLMEAANIPLQSKEEDQM